MEYDYWDERFLLLNEMLLQQGEEYAQNAARAYMLAMLEIEKDINHFYARFANENSMTYQQAKQLLTSEQRQAFQMELEEYIAYGQQNNLDDVWIKKLENASTLHRITRLQAIQYQLQQQVEKLEAQKIKGITETLKNIYKEGYYRTAYEIQKGTGIGQAFSKIDENKIDKVLARAWAPDGKNFSERVWGTDRTQLIYQLQTRFTQGIIRGEASQKIIRDMSKALDSSRKATERLVRTESAFFASASRKDTYENLGVKQYKVLATLDIVTSELCREMDGKIFDVKDYKVGTTANPFHPNCRSTTVPNIDDKYTQNQQRAARNKEGKTYYVPSDMTYKEWHNTFVENDPEWLLQEKKHQNKSADKKQYEQYKAVLGRKEVGSFDNFQEIKYNSDKWDNLKEKKKQNTTTTENEYEGDFTKELRRNNKKRKREEKNIKTIPYSDLPENIRAPFEKGLEYADVDTKRLLKKQIKTTQFAIVEDKNAYNKEFDYVKVKKNIIPSTIAHELFHQIDAENNVSKKGKFLKALQQDYEELLTLSNGNIKSYLAKHYSHAIYYNENNEMRVFEEYRGISDILSGLTRNEVYLGFGHKNSYWVKDKFRLSTEAWAQYGRISYENYAEPQEMLQQLFPRFYDSAIISKKELRKG